LEAISLIMKEKKYDNYQSLKLIEALTSVIEANDGIQDTEKISYLMHTLKFIPWNTEIHDAWTELLKLTSANLIKEFDFDTQQQQLEQLLSNFVTNPIQYFEILTILINNAFENNTIDQALQYTNQQIELAEKEKQEELKVKAYHTKGVIYHLSGQLEFAEQWYKRSLKEVNPNITYDLHNQVLYSLANLYQHYLADYDQAFHYYMLALKLAENADNHEKQAFYLDHLGMASYWKDDIEAAIQYHDRAWQILQSQKQTISTLFHKVQLSMALAKNNEYERVGDELYSVIDLKLKNTDPFSNTWYILTLSDWVAHQPDNFDLLRSEFATKLSLVMEPENLARIARSKAKKSNYAPSLVHSDLYLVRYIHDEKRDEILELLKEAKSIAIQNNRMREVEEVKHLATSLGISYDDL